MSTPLFSLLAHHTYRTRNSISQAMEQSMWLLFSHTYSRITKCSLQWQILGNLLLLDEVRHEKYVHLLAWIAVFFQHIFLFILTLLKGNVHIEVHTRVRTHSPWVKLCDLRKTPTKLIKSPLTSSPQSMGLLLGCAFMSLQDIVNQSGITSDDTFFYHYSDDGSVHGLSSW